MPLKNHTNHRNEINSICYDIKELTKPAFNVNKKLNVQLPFTLGQISVNYSGAGVDFRFIIQVKPFHADALFLYPLKTSENRRF